jgi:hypothetical protein
MHQPFGDKLRVTVREGYKEKLRQIKLLQAQQELALSKEPDHSKVFGLPPRGHP